jgi:hypothetical protein
VRGIPLVYTLYDAEGAAIYVGVTENLPHRLAAHRRRSWYGYVRRVEFREFSSREDAEEFEWARIGELRPRYNRALPARIPPRRPRLRSTQTGKSAAVDRAAADAGLNRNTWLRMRIAEMLDELVVPRDDEQR